MNYYNEFDHNAAEWLRELIAEGLIPPGDVDERSITDVTATDLLGYTQCHFFAGIGGWSLALRLAGWPDNRPAWTGSCPCQCFSTAGKQRGFADERDLWPVFADLIRQCRPEYVFGEQVENAINHGWLDRVYTDMEREGYAVGAHVLGAHSVGAPHRRYRLYWGAVSVADSQFKRPIQSEHRDGSRYTEGVPEGNLCIGGMDDRESIGRGIFDAENIGKADGEINAFANASCGGDRVAHMQGDGRDERRAEPDGRGASAGCGDIGVAENSDGGGCGGRNDGNQTGRRREVQIAGLGDRGGVADGDSKRQQKQCVSITVAANEQRQAAAIGAELRSLSGLPPWSNSRFIYCRDGKVRRIPAESILLRMADGLFGGVDGGGVVGISEGGGFPLTTQKEGRTMLLKGYGNAIVPEVASEFIGAFMETQS